jgi:hypothetical protein
LDRLSPPLSSLPLSPQLGSLLHRRTWPPRCVTSCQPPLGRCASCSGFLDAFPSSNTTSWTGGGYARTIVRWCVTPRRSSSIFSHTATARTRQPTRPRTRTQRRRPVVGAASGTPARGARRSERGGLLVVRGGGRLLLGCGGTCVAKLVDGLGFSRALPRKRTAMVVLCRQTTCHRPYNLRFEVLLRLELEAEPDSVNRKKGNQIIALTNNAGLWFRLGLVNTPEL